MKITLEAIDFSRNPLFSYTSQDPDAALLVNQWGVHGGQFLPSGSPLFFVGYKDQYQGTADIVAVGCRLPRSAEDLCIREVPGGPLGFFPDGVGQHLRCHGVIRLVKRLSRGQKLVPQRLSPQKLSPQQEVVLRTLREHKRIDKVAAQFLRIGNLNEVIRGLRKRRPQLSIITSKRRLGTYYLLEGEER